MNTFQLTYALEHDKITKRKFCSVFPSDRWPRTIDKKPCGFIANTDPSTEPRTHWVEFYFPTELKAAFFDSYGYPTEHYRDTFPDYLNNNSYEWEFSNRKLQSIWSDVCGQYCIFYLSHRARGHSMNKIVQLFSNDTMLNDVKVSRFVKTHFKLALPKPNVNSIQSSKKRIHK